MKKIAAIARVNVVRTLRERSNLFFIFILPLAIIFLIGAQFGGASRPAVGIHLADQDPLAMLVLAEVEGGGSLEAVRHQSRDGLVDAVERGEVQSGVFLPAGMTDAAAAGEQIEIGHVSRPDGAGQQLQSIVSAAVDRVMTPVSAARFAVEKTGADFETALDTARGSSEMASGLEVETTTVGERLFPADLGRFAIGASQQLVLFTFLTALTGSAILILNRQLGLSRRMLSTPTSAGVIVLGEGTGRWAVAMVQALYIVVFTVVAFRVEWGDPLAAAALLVVFSAVGAGAGLLMGATFDNDQQAGGIGVVLSLGLAALGGCMLPLELFSPTMRAVAHITPHAWALDGFAELVRRGGGILDILPELGVLAAYATVLLGLAAWRLRVVITRG